MNTVPMQAAESAGLGWMLGITTLMFMALFVGWFVWLWSPGQAQNMEAASRLPLEDP